MLILFIVDQINPTQQSVSKFMYIYTLFDLEEPPSAGSIAVYGKGPIKRTFKFTFYNHNCQQFEHKACIFRLDINCINNQHTGIN